ncbi:RND family efflux transporter MFP subunit [Salinisphaera sp. PC39]|uniref:efflux RND transporter periplasmic adaptor subunit n=1 Tax=Salinisphaera sp. PC39 TaxID=1304156 RepID=UPI0033412CE5
MTRHLPALTLAAAAIPLLAGCGQATTDTAGSPPPPEVGVVELQPQRVTLSAELPGRTAAYRMAEVRPQVTGILQSRLFKQGARVEAGEMLYRIDPKPYRAAYQRAQADLASARATVGALRQQAARYESLVADNAVSRQEYDDVKAELDRQLAEVQVAEAALSTARIDLDYTEVKAPIDGRIGPTLVTVGALATANQEQVLARVTQLDPIYVDIQRSVEELMRLRRALASGRLDKAAPGQAEVELLLGDGRVYEHPGRLEVSDVTVSQGTGSVTLRAVFPNPGEELLPGMYVRARLSEGVREHAILAPQQGVTRNAQGEATALVVDGDGKVVQRRLEVARAIDSFWLVEDGLAAGDRLIVSGLQKIRPGATVRAVPADIPNKPARGPDPDDPDAGPAPSGN